MSTTPISKIWNFVDGPYSDPEIEECYFVELMVETEDGDIENREVYMPDVESCRIIERYFKTNLGPLTLDEVVDMCYPDQN